MNISPIKERIDNHHRLINKRDTNKLSQDHINNKSIIIKEHMDSYFRKTYARGLEYVYETRHAHDQSQSAKILQVACLDRDAGLT